MIGSSNLYPVVGVEETGSSQPSEALESSEAIGHRISLVSQSGIEDFPPFLSPGSNRMEGSNNDISSLKAEKSFTSELVQSPHHIIDASEETGEWKSNKYFYDSSPLIRGNNDISAPQSEKSSTSELVQSSNRRIDTNEEFREFRKDACVSNQMEGSNNNISSLMAEKSFTSELVQSPHHRIDASEETGEWKSNKYFYDNSPLIRGNNDISAPLSEKFSTSELVQSSNHRTDTNEEFREFRKDACVSNRMEVSNNNVSSLKAEKSFTSELVQSPHHRIDASEETGEWKSNKYFYDNSPPIRGNNDISAPLSEKSSASESVQSSNHRIDANEDTVEQKSGKYFYYDSPLYEDTGFWIPVSVPPMLESDRDEWSCGFGSNGGYFPEEEFNWDQFLGEDKEMTMWDVVSEMLLVARGKVSSLSSGNIISHRMSWISTDILEETWKEMANTLAEANYGNSIEILETEPPKWLSDSAAAACMLCNIRFHPIMCSRHHCRFCGGIFCNDCSKGRSLLPRKFRDANPRRVCDVCCVRLESVQPYLMNQISHASQIPTHDTTDLSTLRSWLNFPWGRTMEYEIYKAANIVRSYCKVGSLKPEKSIPDVILKQAKGLAILTVVNVGMMVTYKVGTGLVLSRREDGSWSPPSAISSFGIGWGAQAGGELTDYIIVLRNEAAIKTFSGNGHLSIGAGLSAAAGIFGRAAEADVRAGDGGIAACYTYSCSKGAFVGCALNGNMVTTRVSENSRFYGAPLKASKILLGSMPRPPAAAILYRALSELFIKLES